MKTQSSKKNFYLILLFFSFQILSATDYYVSPNGMDDSARNGTSPSNAWRTLAYASERVPEGNHRIFLAAGNYYETRPSKVKKGIKIIGNGNEGGNRTTIYASSSWNNPDSGCTNRRENYVVIFRAPNSKTDVNNEISHIEFIDQQKKNINGAIFIHGAKIDVHDLVIRNFRFAGIFARGNDLNLYKNKVYNSSRRGNCDASRLGNISTIWCENLTVHDNYFETNDGDSGYGYRGRGHTNAKIYNNVFNIQGGDFDIEIAHENEYGVEIYDNEFHNPVSLPKSHNQANPNERGYEYSIWVHDNTTTDPYSFEGPRNYLRISHNYINIDPNDTNGTVFTIFGGRCNGPIWIHDNVIVNAGRGLVWLGNSGRPEPNNNIMKNLYIYNNTVYMSKVASPYRSVLDLSGGTTVVDNWELKNNVIIAAEGTRRDLYFNNAQNRDNLDVSHNLFDNVDLVSSNNNNITNGNPEFNLRGNKPFPYYAPNNGNSPIVNAGIDVGLPFLGSAPDIGAFEFSSSEIDGISVRHFDNIFGTSIQDLKDAPNFPNNPNFEEVRDSFEISTNIGDNYGVQIIGYLVPPETGTYYFWIAGDDNVELSLSDSENHANTSIIAYHDAWTTSRQWNKYSSQKSLPINLIAGKHYYIQALMKEAAGGDNLAVGWRKPSDGNGSAPTEVISGAYLLPLEKSFSQDTGSSGLVSMEAEEATSQSNGSGTFASMSWQQQNDATASNSSFMIVPDNGNINSAGTLNGPRLDFEINFVKTGTHYIWVRQKSPNGADNSIIPAFDGVLLADWNMPDALTEWTWSKAGFTFDVTSTGIHTFSIYMREDATPIDKIELTTNANYVPSDTTNGLKAQIDMNTNVSIYPNPVDDELHVQFKSVNKTNKRSVDLYSFNGILLNSQRFTAEESKVTLDTRDLQSGIYVLKITEGTQSIEYKVIKE